MKIRFLGTNGWYDTATGNTICTLIETKRCHILLDAGNGIYKSDKYIKRDKPVYLFLSHFHVDHIEGLHILLKFNFKSLAIIGPPGTKKAIKTFLGRRFSAPIEDLPFPCKVIDVKEGWHGHPIKFQCKKLYHVTPCFGYRFELDGKSIAYCTDTGYCKAAVELAKGSDLLISECAYAPGMVNDEWPHMNPEAAARVATESNTKKMILTHFDANIYDSVKKRRKAYVIAKKAFKNIYAAEDGKCIVIR